MPTSDLPLPKLERRLLVQQESRSLSEPTLRHYRDTFRDLDRFLTAMDRRIAASTLTSELRQAFHRWLKATMAKMELPTVGPRPPLYAAEHDCSLALKIIPHVEQLDMGDYHLCPR